MQLKLHMVTIEDLVPQEHFLRKLEAALDLSFVYRETEKLYSRRYGRPPIDPVMLVKYLLVGYLYGIPSERQIEQRIQTDVALRWYLGLDLLDRVPDHSTISQLRRRKPSFRKVFRRLFEEVVEQCVIKGLASGRLVATDSTHVKANASPASEHLVEAAQKPGAYWERLDAYEEEALEELERTIQAGKTGRKRRQKGRSRQVKSPLRYDRKWTSRTDPESGHLNRPGKPKGPHYLSHQTVDCDHGIILDVAVTSGEVNDAVPYLRQIEHIHQEIIPIRAASPSGQPWQMRPTICRCSTGCCGTTASAFMSGPCPAPRRPWAELPGLPFSTMRRTISIPVPAERRCVCGTSTAAWADCTGCISRTGATAPPVP